jgi:hypothetical protein
VSDVTSWRGDYGATHWITQWYCIRCVCVCVCVYVCIYYVAEQPKAGQGRSIFEVSRSHTRTRPQLVGLLWASDRPVAETSTWQHTTLTRDRHPSSWRDSNPQSQQASGRRLSVQTARPHTHARAHARTRIVCSLCENYYWFGVLTGLVVFHIFSSWFSHFLRKWSFKMSAWWPPFLRREDSYRPPLDLIVDCIFPPF